MSIRVESHPRDDCQVELVVEVDSDRVQGAMRAAARRLSERINVPGFRKGKAPFDVVRRQVGDNRVLDEALNELGPQVYQEALEAGQVDPYAPGALADVRLDPMVLTFNVPLQPEVDLGDYRDIRLEHKPAEPTDEDVERAVESLREGHALIEPADRPAAMGDIVTADVRVELMRPAAGEAPSEVERLLTEGEDDILLKDGDAAWLPSLIQAIVGISADETREFDLILPDDYADEDLRGRTVRARVAAKAVKSRLLPAWSDQFAQGLGDFQSLLDLRIKVRQDLQQHLQRLGDSQYAQSVVEQAVNGAQVKFPPTLLNAELDDLIEELRSRLRRQGLTLEDYLRIQKTTIEALRTELEPRARDRVGRALVLSRVVRAEGLKVQPEEVEARVDQFAGLWGERKEEIRKSLLASTSSRQRFAMEALTEKGVERLVEIAKGQAPPLPEPSPVGDEASAEPVATNE